MFWNQPRPPRDFISILIEDIGNAIELDLSTAIAHWGRKLFLLQVSGAAQGSPLSVFIANLVATYLEQREWQTLHSNIKLICPTIINILRMRWVDDLFFYLVSTETVPDSIFEQIQQFFSSSYAPFSLKIEDPTVFVGFRHYATTTKTGETCVDFAVDVRIQCERYSTQIPKYVHAVSNIPQAQVFGLFKGSIIRCIDCASN